MNNKKNSNKKRNNTWENLQGFRYAHRGLFHQPRSASKKHKPDTAGGVKSAEYKPSEDKPLWLKDIELWKGEGKEIVPENSMEAFRMAVHYSFGSELDVHLTADGIPVVFHDDNLYRMTGIDCRIDDMTWDELSKVGLLGTQIHIPLLEEVLELYTSESACTGRRDARESVNARGISDDLNAPDGRETTDAPNAPDAQEASDGRCIQDEQDKSLHLPLIIELKIDRGNISGLCSKVMDMLDRYPRLNYCVESFDPRAVLWLKRHRPDVIRGQLTENFMKSRDAVRKWGYLMTFGMWSVVPDIFSRPDFIACKFKDRKNPFILLSCKAGVKQVNWVIRNQRELEIVDREGGISIFERFMPDKVKNM